MPNVRVRFSPCSSHTTVPLGSNHARNQLQGPTPVSPANSSPTGTVCQSRRFWHLSETCWARTGNMWNDKRPIRSSPKCVLKCLRKALLFLLLTRTSAGVRQCARAHVHGERACRGRGRGSNAAAAPPSWLYEPESWRLWDPEAVKKKQKKEESFKIRHYKETSHF